VEDQDMNEIEAVADIAKEAEGSGPDTGEQGAAQTKREEQQASEEEVPWNGLQGSAYDVCPMKDFERITGQKDTEASDAERRSKSDPIAEGALAGTDKDSGQGSQG
jgi:hypothetical protein